jgi:nitrogen regulatory protein P-II 2
MKTLHPMKLVTVICEALAREPLIRLLEQVGAHGFTLFPVEGEGAQGRRSAEIEELANIQVEIILPPEVAQKLMDKLSTDFFPRYAMVAYEMDVRVLRPGKF